jgi:hypothetical protein
MAGERWFRPKPSGDGVEPATWQAWAAILLAVVTLLCAVVLAFGRALGLM